MSSEAIATFLLRLLETGAGVALDADSKYCCLSDLVRLNVARLLGLSFF